MITIPYQAPTGALPLTWGGRPAIWLAWTGTNPLPDLLALCLASVRRHNAADFEVIVVTPENLHRYVDPHPAYNYLSLRHRSDYLRLWLLHRYGGMYLDMDTIALRSLKNLYENICQYDLVTYDGTMWGGMFGTGVFGPTRRDSVLTRAWSEELESLLDRRYDDLAAFRRCNPDEGTDCLRWSEVCGEQLPFLANRLADAGQLSIRLLEPTWTHFAEGGPRYEDLFRAGFPEQPDTELLILNYALIPEGIRCMSWRKILGSELGLCHLLREALGRNITPQDDSFSSELLGEAIADLPLVSPSTALHIDWPVRLASTVRGMWPDNWVAGELRFRVAVEAPVHAVVVEGWRPEQLNELMPLVLTVGETRASQVFGGGPFHWRIPCALAPGDEVLVELTAGWTWSPATDGESTDDRQLAFVLQRLAFEPAVEGVSLQGDGQMDLRQGGGGISGVSGTETSHE